MVARILSLGLLAALAPGALGCDLCAIYNADAASGLSKGFSLTVSEQYIPYDTPQLDGHTLPPSDLDNMFLDKSMSHIVPTWSFSSRFSVSLSLPVIYEHFRFMQLLPTAPFIETIAGEKTGIGDLALIGRCTPLRLNKGQASVSMNLLAGVKFPTGSTKYLEQKVAFERAWEAVVGPGHNHTISGVHLSDLTFGSGSYDGIFGTTVNSRWRRVYANAQFQYYLRTPGVPGYQFGDEWMISGGPGVYAFLNESFTLSGQALAVYDHMDQDLLLGEKNPNSGSTAIYLGPQLYLTVGERFSANAGVDFPMRIDNNGLQNVPNYRVHFGASFRF